MKTHDPHGLRLSEGGGSILQRVLWPVLGAAALVAAARAEGPIRTHTATGQHVALAFPGAAVVLPDGEHLRHQVEILRLESGDIRMAGRRILVVADAWKTPQGTIALAGTWTGEPGLWNGTVFTATGGSWDGSWSGLRQADGSLQMHFSGRGVGGDVDGQELKETASRPAGPDQDPSLAFAFDGKTAPADQWFTTLFEDDFEDGIVNAAWHFVQGWETDWYNCTATASEQNGVLRFHLAPKNTQPIQYMNAPWSVPLPVSLNDEQTAEVRMDLVDLGDFLPSLILAPTIWTSTAGVPTGSGGQSIWVQTGSVNLTKAWGWGDDYVALRRATMNVLQRQLTLSIAYTPTQSSNAVLRGRILDRAMGGKVLYDRVWLDTPASDRADGGGGDMAGRPTRNLLEAGFYFGFFPGTPTPPPRDLSVTIDNFSFRVYEASPYEMGIARAILLTPPATAQPYVVEGAASVTGPWTALSAPSVAIEGTRRLVVPIPEGPSVEFFRIR